MQVDLAANHDRMLLQPHTNEHNRISGQQYPRHVAEHAQSEASESKGGHYAQSVTVLALN